jgi:hypothetical protein
MTVKLETHIAVMRSTRIKVRMLADLLEKPVYKLMDDLISEALTREMTVQRDLYWTRRWQDIEREAQADIDAGRVRRFANVEEAIADLEKTPVPEPEQA